MKIDAQELHRLAAAQPRLDMYGGIHKAVRACMADALVELGRADTADQQAVDEACRKVEELLDFCAGHVRHENDHVHKAIEARVPGASDAIAHEHVEHLEHIAQLRAATHALRASAPVERACATQLLYGSLALFVADNLRHMHVEETAHNAVLWARYTDAELEAIHDGLVASIPPQEMTAIARWLVPSINPAERLALLSDMRAKAPPPAFEAILATVRPHLRAAEWAQLSTALGLAAVPGLASA